MHSFVTPAPPDLPPSPDILRVDPDTSIGIAEVRSIQTFLSRKPVQLPHATVIINSAHLLTLPAQQAILKTLEEPPLGSQIYLVTTQPDLLLPTILSRCLALSATTAPPPPDPDKLALASHLFQSLVTSDSPHRLALLDTQNFTRDTALDFFTLLEHLYHTSIATNSTLLFEYDHLVTARKYLQSNVNVRLVMDQFVLHLT